LDEKLETAAKLLDDCAGLVVELDIYEGKLSGIGTCLGIVFQVQERIYSERPDLLPQFLKGAYELRKSESKPRRKKK
jgi:hypothetical protein